MTTEKTYQKFCQDKKCRKPFETKSRNKMFCPECTESRRRESMADAYRKWRQKERDGRNPDEHILKSVDAKAIRLGINLIEKRPKAKIAEERRRREILERYGVMGL